MNGSAWTRFPLQTALPLAAGLVVILLVAAYSPPSVQWLILAAATLVLLLRVMAVSHSFAVLVEEAELLRLPLVIAKDPQLLDVSRRMAGSLEDIVHQFDPICRTMALTRIEQIERELRQISQGRFVFTGTETWRLPYEQLLRSQGLYRYRSVAFVKTANYWQDEPGRQSTQINCEVAKSGAAKIERIVILADSLWPSQERFPIQPILAWLEEQQRAGIQLKLVRQSAVESEPDLVADYGIYGNRAVGYQEVDERGRTVQFTLNFDISELLAAEARWERLTIFAGSFSETLDQVATYAYDRH